MLRGFLCLLSSKTGTGNSRSSLVATFKPLFAIALTGLWILAGLPAAAFPVAPSGPFVTLTTLAVTSGGSAVTSVASGAKVTLTASVTANGNPVTVGLVNFCDASGAYCTDIHLLGSAQLTSLGTSAISFYPGIGSHSYKAVYVGTPGATTTIYLPSVSSPNAALTVTGLYPTATAITNVTGSAPPYSVTATVTGYVNSTSVVAPAGTVSIFDTSNSNYLLGSTNLGTSTPGLGFLNSQTAAVGSNPEAIAMGDFNGDGIPDLAVANYAFPGTVTILLGQGDGTFKEATAANLGGSCLGSCSPLSAGDGPISVAVGDFNGDGIPDLVVADISGTDSGYGVMVFLGNGDGTFTHKSSPQTTVYPHSVAVGDFNGDGIPDLAVSSQCTDPDNCAGKPGVVTILLGNGDGTFAGATGSPITVGEGPAFVTTGDFNGDGKIDLAVSNLQSDTVTILLGNGDGTFTEATAANLGGTCKGMCSPLSVTQSTHGTNYQLQFSSIAVGDFNNDGIPDLAMSNQSGYLVIFLGQGDGTFAQSSDSPIAISGGLSMPTGVAVGDFNGDGHADLAVTDGQSWNMVSILLGNGDGTFTQTATTAASNSDALVVGDFNRDGVPDIAATAWPGSSVTVLLTQMTQTATTTTSSISPNGVGTHNVAANYSAGATYASSTSTTTPLAGIAPASITVMTGNNQSAFVTTAFTTSLEVQVLDAGNNPMPGTTVNFAVPPSGASATLSSYAVTTDSYGEAMVTATANATGGSYTVSAGVGTLSTGFGLTNTTVSGIAVTTLTDDASGVIANCIDPSLSATSCSLRDAIATAAAESTSTLTPTITFASSLNLTTTAPGDYNVTTGGTLNIGASMNITGPGLKLLSIDGGGATQVFNISGGPISISGLTITNGNFSTGNGKGAGIYNSGTLIVANCAFNSNKVTVDGGAIFNSSGALTVTNSSFSNNSAPYDGGAIFSDFGTTTVTGSTFTGNATTTLGGEGGGIFNNVNSTLQVVTTTFTGNSAPYMGGGIYNSNGALSVSTSTFSANSTGTSGGGIFSDSANWTVTNSTFSGNSVPYGGGGGIGNNSGALTIVNSTFSGNAAPYGNGVYSEGGGKLYLVNVLSPDSIPYIDSNVGSVLSGSINLAPLGNYGGPTQTMPPLPTETTTAMCAGLASGLGNDASGKPITLTTTDQRGNPRPTTIYKGVTCVDAGAVQTAYSLQFAVSPSSPQHINQVLVPAPAVQLYDNGQAIALPGVAVGMDFGGSGLGGSRGASTDATGLSTWGNLIVSTAQTGVYLAAYIQGNWGSAGAYSGNFDVDLQTQTINITQVLPTTAIYNGVNLNSSTSATGGTSGNPVIFTIDPKSTAPATITSAGALTISGPGTVIVDANQAGGGSYAAAAQVQQTITVTPDAPATIVVSSGGTQSAYVGTAFTNNLTAQVIDGSGTGVYGVTVTFAAPPSDPSATLSAYTVVTDLNGMASVTATANATSGGPYLVTASYPGSGFAVFKLTNQPPPVFTVTTLADDVTGTAANCTDQSLSGAMPDANCSLRDAIAAATAVSTSTVTPTVNFASSLNLSASTPGDYNVTTGGILNIDANMNITGPGANLLSIDGANTSGVPTTQVFFIAPRTVSISGLTITNGKNLGNGGGIQNAGTLTVTNCTFSSNFASFGSAIFSQSTLTVANSTFSGNFAAMGAGVGGGIYNAGTAAVTNSTFSGNSVVMGGGIFSPGTLTVTNSTFSGNSALGDSGGGIYNSGMVTVTNSTFSGNTAPFGSGAGMYNEGQLTLANDLSADSANGGNIIDMGGNQIVGINGVTAGSSNLAALGDYGGPTQTMPPLPSSAAICAGLTKNIPSGVTTDQRGNPRSTTAYGTTACVDSGAVQTAYSLTFTTSPSNPQQTGTAFTPSPAVQLKDLNPNTGQLAPIALGGAPITVALNAGVFSSGASSVSTDLNGVSTFGGLVVSTSTALPSDQLIATAPVGPYTITANSGNFDIDLVPQTINITQALPTTPIYNGLTLSYSTSATGGTSGNPVIFTIDSISSPGIASITIGGALTITGPGTVIVDANQAGGGNYAAATQVQQTIQVALDAPATIAVYSGNRQSARIGSTFTNNLTVQVTDAGGNGVYGVGVTYAAPSTGPSAALTAYNVITDVNGLASVMATANRTQGPYQVTAYYPGSGFATFGLTNLPPPVYAVTTLADDNPNGDGTGNANLCNDTSAGDAPNSGCSLRDAIAAAAAASTSTLTPTVTFAGSLNLTTTAPGDYNVTTGGTLNIANNMNIVGPGANQLSIDGGNAVEVFDIASGMVSISGLTIANGSTSTNGGGIYSDGTLTVSSVSFTGNAAPGSYPGGQGGAIFNDADGVLSVSNGTFTGNSAAWQGAAILDCNTLTVTNSTFSGNTSQGGSGILVCPGVSATVAGSTFSGNTAQAGAGIFSTGNVTLTNSTFSGNIAQGGDGEGAAIYQWQSSGTLTVINSTFSGNTAQNQAGGIYNNSSTVNLTNTIVAGNTAAGNPDDFEGTIYTNDGGNIVGYYSASVINAPTASLAPLGNYGGPTQTMPPLPGSPAICAGGTFAASHAGLTTDQRGNPRSTMAYGSTACVDAGAVQTAYSLQFTTSPSSYQETNVALTPAPVVQLYDLNPATGQPAPISLPGAPITLAIYSGAIGGGVPTVGTASNGVSTFNGVTVTTTETGDYLIARAPAGPYSIAANSSNFNIVAITLSPAAGPLSAGAYGAAYSQQFTASNGTAPYSYTATGLPSGLSINLGTGLMSGTPTSIAGSPYTVVVTVTDSASDTIHQSYTLAVGPAASAISVSGSVNPVFVQDTVTYTAAVGFATAPSSTTIPGPAGTVTFYDSGTVITACSAAALGTYNSTTNAALTACTVSYASVTPASHAITATYTPASANFTGSSSGTLTETLADFTIAAQNASLTIMPGASGQYSFTVSPQSPATTFPTAVNLTVSGLPAGYTYSFSPSATIAVGAGSSNVTLNIQPGVSAQNSPKTGGWPASRLAGISLALLLLPFIGRLRRAGKRFSRMLPILLLLIAGMAAAVGLSGCGSNTGFFGQSQQNYPLTVTATSGTLSRTSNVTLTVE